MPRPCPRRYRLMLTFMLAVGSVVHLTGCAPLQHWWHNGAMVGPNYGGTSAPIAGNFNNHASPVVRSEPLDDPEWWKVFQDPDLDLLIERVHQENLTLKSIANRIAEARAIRNIAAANLFPQRQQLTADYIHTQNSRNLATAFPGFPVSTDNWAVGFDASWEADLWGRIRRSVDSADANLEATIADYDFALVTLIGDVASLYINIRTLDERIRIAEDNIEAFEGLKKYAEIRALKGETSDIDVAQSKANLAQTQALLPQLELARRQSLNALAVLLAIPPSEIEWLSNEGEGRVPDIPAEVIVGIPAELLQRRPDLRAAERRLASQFEQIGIAEADLYPTLTISGTLGYEAASLSDLVDTDSYSGFIAPGFRWNLLNYGRIRNGVRVEQARVNQLCFDYQQAVLDAQREVEDGIIEFVKYRERYELDRLSESATREAAKLTEIRFKAGETGYFPVYVIRLDLVSAQDQLVATKANVALSLIRTYKALGGGWEIRCQPPRDEAIRLSRGTESANAFPPPSASSGAIVQPVTPPTFTQPESQ